jgi:hypothetical protein
MSVQVDGATSCDGRCVNRLLEDWPVTGFDDAATLTRSLTTEVLTVLLDFERENSDRPRYRRLLRRRIDARAPAGPGAVAPPCACTAPVQRTAGTTVSPRSGEQAPR